MRNRGYKYIIKKNNIGYLFLCINATWINQMLRDRGVKPRDFKKLTWEDIANVQTDARRKRFFETLKPKSFWEMCDTLSLSYVEYELDEPKTVRSKLYTKFYEKEWFIKNPVFTQEDIFEILMERGFQQEDALRVMEVVRHGKCCTLKLSPDEFMQLYDVPEDLYNVIKRCKYIPPREKVLNNLLDCIERAAYLAAMQETSLNKSPIDEAVSKINSKSANKASSKATSETTANREKL